MAAQPDAPNRRGGEPLALAAGGLAQRRAERGPERVGERVVASPLTPTMTLDFYFDFVSPYAYLAWRRAPALLGEGSLRPVAVLLGPILEHHGQLGPAEIAPKRAFTIRDTARRAADAGVPLVWPVRHPFRSVAAARLVHAAREQERPGLIDALFSASWGRGGDLEDPAVLGAAIAEAGLDAARLQAEGASGALRREVASAIARGVFGVPTMIDEEGELFFGDDQLSRVAAKRDGLDALDERRRAEALAVEARPLGVARRRPGGASLVAPVRTPPLLELDGAVEEHVLGVFSKAKFLTALGVEVVRLGEGESEIALTVRDDHLQQDGFVHAGVLATMADHNAGACAATAAPAGSGVLTIEFKVNLLRPSTGPRVRCRSRVLRAGKTISIVESEVFDERASGEVLVAKATVTLAVRRPEPGGDGEPATADVLPRDADVL
jgi:uncharacterized protein (TIGR00369 family)